MAQFSCLLCREVKNTLLTNSDAFSVCSNTFNSILENVFDHLLPVLEPEQCLCEKCVDLLNEYELAKLKYEHLKEKIINYCVAFRVQPKKFDACCQTEELLDTEFQEIRSTTDEISENVEFEFVDSEVQDLDKGMIVLEEFKCLFCYESFITEDDRIAHLKAMHQITIKKESKRDSVRSNDDKKCIEASNNLSTIKNESGGVLMKPIIIGGINLGEYLAKPDGASKDSYKLVKPNVKKKVIKKRKTKCPLGPIIISDTNINEQLFNESVDCSGIKVENTFLFKCELCLGRWETQDELEEHVCQTREQLECSDTEMAADTQTILEPFICEICGQIFKRKHDLDPHIRAHSGIYPFVCSYCSKPFTKKASLQRHLPIHTGVIQFQCDLCGKSFIHNSSFTTHMLLHAGRKDFKCKMCGFALFSRTHLERHMRVHTGEKPYNCEYCPKSFAEKYNLYTHLKVHKKYMQSC